MTRAVLYARVSSEEQAADGKASIPAQLEACRKLADDLKYIIAGEYVDDRKYRVGRKLVEPSGERTDRPQWLAMLQALRDGQADAVIAHHASRLYRNYRPALDFLELVETHNITVKLAAESFDPRVAMLFAWRDREENKARVGRSAYGKIQAVRDGFSATRHTPFYRTVRDARGERVGCELREEYRPFLDRCAQLFLQRVSYARMAERLGTNPVSGAKLTAQVVRGIMSNPFFRGQAVYGGRAQTRGAPHFQAKGIQAPAWDAQTCAAIALEVERRNAVGLSTAHPHKGVGLFWGLLRCGYCGHVLTAHTSRGYVRYYCHASSVHAMADHRYNAVSERKAVRLLEEFSAVISDAASEAWLPLFATPEHSDLDPSPRLALEQALAETQAELDSLPATSRRARLALSVEAERLTNQLALLAAEQAVDAAPPVDPEQVRANWACLGQNLRSMTRAEIAAIIPAIYIKDRKIALPVPVRPLR